MRAGRVVMDWEMVTKDGVVRPSGKNVISLKRKLNATGRAKRSSRNNSGSVPRSQATPGDAARIAALYSKFTGRPLRAETKENQSEQAPGVSP